MILLMLTAERLSYSAADHLINPNRAGSLGESAKRGSAVGPCCRVGRSLRTWSGRPAEEVIDNVAASNKDFPANPPAFRLTDKHATDDNGFGAGRMFECHEPTAVTGNVGKKQAVLDAAADGLLLEHGHLADCFPEFGVVISAAVDGTLGLTCPEVSRNGMSGVYIPAPCAMGMNISLRFHPGDHSVDDICFPDREIRRIRRSKW